MLGPLNKSNLSVHDPLWAHLGCKCACARFVYGFVSPRACVQAETDLPSAKDLEVAFVLADEDKSGGHDVI